MALRSALHRPGVVLAPVLVVAGALRLWGLGEIPPGLFCDEVAMGANAMCLATHGRSLKGEALPLWVHEPTFASYGNHRVVYQPIYQYTLVPFVRLFGLSAWAVRLPSVLYGVLGVAAAYGMGTRLFDRRVGLIAAIFLALSPWHHHYSRIAFEVICLPVFLATGTCWIFRGLKEKRFLVAGAAVFALSTYAYPAARLFVPLLMAGFFVIYRKELWAARTHTLLGILTAVTIALPNLYLLLTDPNQGQMYGIFIWSADITGEAGVRYVREGAAAGGPAAAIAGNRGVLVPFLFLYNYFTFLSPKFLFLSGDSRALYAAQGMGMCYLFLAPFLAVGLWTLAREWREKKHRFLLWWFLTWPIPSSLTIHHPHATRGMTNFPVIEVIAALGLGRIAAAAGGTILRAGGRTRTAILASGICLFAAFRFPVEVARYLAHYHGEFGVYSGRDFDAGMEEAFRRIREMRKEGEQVCVAPEVYNAHMNILFFADTDYRKLKPGPPDQEGFLPAGWRVPQVREAPTRRASTLWLVKAREIRQHSAATVISRIPYPDGKPHLAILRYPKTPMEILLRLASDRVFPPEADPPQ